MINIKINAINREPVMGIIIIGTRGLITSGQLNCFIHLTK